MRNLLGSTARIIAVLVVFVLQASAQTERAKTDADIKAFENVIRTFFEGNDLTPVKGMIHPEAYIIHGQTYESIFNLMSEASRRQLFGSAQQNEMKFFHAYINDGKTTAYVVVKTDGADKSTPRYHTVVFVKSAGKEWRLLHWHAST